MKKYYNFVNINSIVKQIMANVGYVKIVTYMIKF